MANHKLDISLPIEMEHHVTGTAAARLVVARGATPYRRAGNRFLPTPAVRNLINKRCTIIKLQSTFRNPIRNFLIFSR
jgi:hypothetical protein